LDENSVNGSVLPTRADLLGCTFAISFTCQESRVGTKKTGKGRRKIGRKKRRMRSKIRHRKG